MIFSTLTRNLFLLQLRAISSSIIYRWSVLERNALIGALLSVSSSVKPPAERGAESRMVICLSPQCGPISKDLRNFVEWEMGLLLLRQASWSFAAVVAVMRDFTLRSCYQISGQHNFMPTLQGQIIRRFQIATFPAYNSWFLTVAMKKERFL